jgi:hypothetical protein
MRTRSVLAAAAAFALIVAPAAGAATKHKPKPKPKPKVYCNLLTDPSGDGTSKTVLLEKSSGLDVLGGDLATGAKTMVAVLRLGSTNFSSDTWAKTGYSWRFGAQSNLGQTYLFNASLAAGSGVLTNSAAVDGTGVHVDFAIDKTKNTLTWTIQRKDVPNLGRPHNIFAHFFADSYGFVGNADNTTATAATDVYPDKGLSCIHAS